MNIFVGCIGQFGSFFRMPHKEEKCLNEFKNKSSTFFLTTKMKREKKKKFYFI